MSRERSKNFLKDILSFIWFSSSGSKGIWNHFWSNIPFTGCSPCPERDRCPKTRLAALCTAFLILMTGIWAAFTFGCHALGGASAIGTLFAIGFIAGGLAPTLWAFAREISPFPVLRLTTGLLNPSIFLGGATLQPCAGAVLDRIGKSNGLYSILAYKYAFSVFLTVTARCIILSVLLGKRHSRPP